MTEDKVIKAFMRKNHVVRYLTANIYYKNFECDILKATPKRDGEYLLTEYEVKITKADLKKDRDKATKSFTTNYGKYQWLAEGKRVNKFYYIMPYELWETIYNSREYLELIPSWAGVICIYESCGSIAFMKHRNCKALSKNYFKHGITDMLLDKFYYSYWNMRIKDYFKRG